MVMPWFLNFTLAYSYSKLEGRQAVILEAS